MDELYSEIAPAFSSKLFNISCDETWDLGMGQTGALVRKYGIASVYAGHINKLHDLLAARGKRVMMWADIALKHPDILGELPKDLIFLPWGYSAQDDFRDQLVPISRTGHDFIVCPGASCWGRMFPNINTAEKNINSFTRDGALFNALGVLNTTWDDDGENLFGYNWYPVAWGAEKSWNPVSGNIDSFRASFSQSFYGTPDDSAVLGSRKLADAAEVFDYQDLRDDRFWSWPPASKFPAGGTAASEAKRLLNFAKDAESYFIAAKKTATDNRENLDYPIFAARRIANLAERNLDYYKCMKLYKSALADKDASAALPKLAEIRGMLKKDLSELLSIRKQYEALWLRENRPYWLDKNQAKYDALEKTIRSADGALEKAAAGLKTGAPLPPANDIFNAANRGN